jgi:phosphoribosylamine--glycine ligase
MGAYSPAAIMTPEITEQTMQEIILPTLKAMAARGAAYRGVLFAGLMLTPQGPKLIEYNCRFGDPECQVLMQRLDSDIVPSLLAAANGSLADMTLSWHDDVAMTVVMAANNYPGAYEKGSVIKQLETITPEATPDVMVFHAGTARSDAGEITAIGGRVLNVTAKGKTVAQARAKAYSGVEKINWPGGFCRQDIGWREIEREQKSGEDA